MENIPTVQKPNTRKFSIPWLLYLLFFLSILISGLITTIKEQTLFDFIDLAISTASIIGLALFTFKRSGWSSMFWKIYVIAFPIYDISKNVLVDPLFRGKPFSFESAIGGLVVLPIYIALILFAYRRPKERINFSPVK